MYFFFFFFFGGGGKFLLSMTMTLKKYYFAFFQNNIFFFSMENSTKYLKNIFINFFFTKIINRNLKRVVRPKMTKSIYYKYIYIRV